MFERKRSNTSSVERAKKNKKQTKKTQTNQKHLFNHTRTSSWSAWSKNVVLVKLNIYLPNRELLSQKLCGCVCVFKNLSFGELLAFSGELWHHKARLE